MSEWAGFLVQSGSSPNLLSVSALDALPTRLQQEQRIHISYGGRGRQTACPCQDAHLLCVSAQKTRSVNASSALTVFLPQLEVAGYTELPRVCVGPEA